MLIIIGVGARGEWGCVGLHICARSAVATTRPSFVKKEKAARINMAEEQVRTNMAKAGVRTNTAKVEARTIKEEEERTKMGKAKERPTPPNG